MAGRKEAASRRVLSGTQLGIGPQGARAAFVGGPRDSWRPLALSGQSWEAASVHCGGRALHGEGMSCSKNARRAPLRNC